MNGRSLIFIVFVCFLFSACARYPKLNEAESCYDPEINNQTGRIVFMKSNHVGEYGTDSGEIVLALLSGQTSDQYTTYKIYEITGNTLTPIEEFYEFRKVTPSFYIDVPVGDHRYMITRTRTDFFITHFTGNSAIVDIAVKKGKTYPIIFGVGDVFGGENFYPDILAYHYQLQENDITYLYDLRKLDISGASREEKITNYKINTLPFGLAAKAIAWMEPSSGPSKEFIKWTQENETDLQEVLHEGVGNKIQTASFDVYNSIE